MAKQYTVDTLISMRVGSIISVADLPQDTDGEIIFAQFDHQVDMYLSQVNQNDLPNWFDRDDYETLFVILIDGEIAALFGMDGEIPFLSKPLDKLM